MKPDCWSQGRGIFLSKNVDHIFQKTQTGLQKEFVWPPVEQDHVTYIVQQYIDRPHLVDGLKYDLRLYVLLYGVEPLRIYLHQMAFARFCTEPYKRPTRENISNSYMHLTNYAINKFADNYEDCENEEGDAGHKRSLGAMLKILKKEGANIENLMTDIKQIIVKTIIAGQPQLAYLYKVCQPECPDNSMCF